MNNNVAAVCRYQVNFAAYKWTNAFKASLIITYDHVHHIIFYGNLDPVPTETHR